jgi:hypothetical protein
MRRRTFLRIALAGGAGVAFARYSGFFDRDQEGVLAPVLVVPPPPVVSRAQWGADESRRKDDVHFDNRVYKIVVHHTATANDASS